MLESKSVDELLTVGPRFVGSPKVKSAFTTSAARPNIRTSTSEIVFLITRPFQKLLIFLVLLSVRTLSGSRLFYKTKNLLIENHFVILHLRKHYNIYLQLIASKK